MSSFHFEFSHTCDHSYREPQQYIEAPVSTRITCTPSFCQGIIDGSVAARDTRDGYSYNDSTIRGMAWEHYGQRQPNTMLSSRDEYIRGYEIGWHTANYVLATMPSPYK